MEPVLYMNNKYTLSREIKQIACVPIHSVREFCLIFIANGCQYLQHLSVTQHTHTINTHNHFTAHLDFVRDYPGEPAPES